MPAICLYNGPMTHRKRTAPLAALLCVCARSLALDLSLAEATAMAKESNASFRQRQISLEQARCVKANEWNNFLPAIAVGAEARNSHANVSSDSSGKERGFSNEWDWAITGSLSLTLASSLPVSIKKDIIAYRSELESYNAAVNELEAKVAASYFSLVSGRENLAILNESLSLAKAEYDETSRRYARGLASELDRLNAQYSYESVKPSIMSAESAYAADMAAFAVLLGLDSADDLNLTDELGMRRLSLPDSRRLAQDYAASRSDVLLRQYALEAARLSSFSTKLDSYAPATVSLRESVPIKNKSGAGEGDLSGTLTLSVSIPLDGFVPGSKTSLRVRAADDAVAVARLNLDTALKEGRSDIAIRAGEIARLDESISVAELSLAIARRSSQMSLEGYRAGLVSQTDLEGSRQKLLGAEQAMLTARVNYLNGVYALATSLNMTVEELYRLFGEGARGGAEENSWAR